MSHSTVQTPVGDYTDTDWDQSRRKQCVLTLSRRPIIPNANLLETWKSQLFSHAGTQKGPSNARPGKFGEELLGIKCKDHYFLCNFKNIIN